MDCFDEGVVMGSEGHPLTDCPYKRGTDNYYNWVAGWQCATETQQQFDTTWVDTSLALILAGCLVLVASIYGAFICFN